MPKRKPPTNYKLDDAHFFRCERVSTNSFRYEVRRGDAQLSRRLFSTACKAKNVAQVEVHAREELRLLIERERTNQVKESVMAQPDGTIDGVFDAHHVAVAFGVPLRTANEPGQRTSRTRR